MATKSKKTSLKEVVGHTAARMTKSPKLRPGKAKRITIEKADDDSGYSVETHHHDNGETYEPPHHSVHKSLASVHKHNKMAFEGNNPGDEPEGGMDNEMDEDETD